jgi:hypothetical protein
LAQKSAQHDQANMMVDYMDMSDSQRETMKSDKNQQ